MNVLSLKGIGAGVLTALILSIPVGFLSFYYVSATFDELAPGVNFANETQVREFVARSIRHPLTITVAFLATLIYVGIPGYIAALVANRAFVANSMAIGAILSLLCLVEWDLVVNFPALFGVAVGLSMLVAFGAGHLRQWQVVNRAT